MAKFKNYEINNEEEVCAIGRAFSSPIRLKILQLLYEDCLIMAISHASWIFLHPALLFTSKFWKKQD